MTYYAVVELDSGYHDTYEFSNEEEFKKSGLKMIVDSGMSKEDARKMAAEHNRDFGELDGF